MIKITESKVFPIKHPKPGSKFKAYAQITIENEFVIKGIRIVEGSNGLFIGFPQTKGADEQYYDITFPITKELREYMSNTILEKYAETAVNEPIQNKSQNDDDQSSEW